ncbi:MAG TPA: hypothetical protein VFY93_11070 [Planctomycetota bacterium]|nr:hypothetical protein [Planctomycetota bacterium]
MFDLDRFLVRRKVFRILGAGFHVYDPTGNVVGFSEQRAFKLKEDIRVYTDDRKSTELLSIRARQIVDFSAAYDVVDSAQGKKVGALRRKGWSSILRDSWEILDDGDRVVARVREDSTALALLRRFLTNLIPQSFHVIAAGERQVARMRQHFNPFVFKLDVEIDAGCPIDRRLILSAAILLAAIEGRQG